MDTHRKEGAALTAEVHASVPELPRKTALWLSIGLIPHLAVVFALGAIVQLTFSNTLRNTGFALDNKFIILDDPRLREANRTNLRLVFQEDYWWPKAVSGLYRPLTTLSYMFNYAVLGNGTNSTGYHWFNFSLHWLNAVLVYFMALVLMENLWHALFTAALFATHPIVTESVSNIIGRADLFATAAIVGGLLCYAKSTTMNGWRKVPWLAALMVVTTVGEFCKESAVVVLGVMALYDFTYRMQRRHPNWFANLIANFSEFTIKGYVALIPPFAGLWYVRSLVFEKLRPPELPFVDNPLVGWDFWTARMTAIKVIGKYLWLLLWPQTLSCDYSYNQIPMVNWHFSTWEDLKALVALISVITVILVTIRNHHRNKPLFFFMLFFFGTFLPTSNLIVIIGSIMAERFMYLPSIGFAGCVVIAVYAVSQRIIPQLSISARARLISPPVLSCSALSLIVLAYGVRAFIRNFDWDNDIALWSADVKVCPNSFKTHKSLAYALYERDQQKTPPDFPDIDRIIEEGEKTRAVMEDKPLPPLYRTGIVYLHLGAYYRIKGDVIAQRALDAGRPWYQKSAEALNAAIQPDRAFNDDNRKKELARGHTLDQIPDIGNQEIYWNLGLAYIRTGQYQNALKAYLYMRHLAPTNPDAYLSIASVYVVDGKTEDAAISLLQALLLDGNRQEALRLLLDLYRQIDREGCAVAPNQPQLKLNADCPLVHNHICSAYSGLVQVFLDAKQVALAQQSKQVALKTYNCAAEQFQKLLPDSTTTTSPGK
ncbi:MAG: DUF1736 domain-containing protein [Verrucomicrobiia bacterium]